ncbi:hypothetical protein C4D60_Mb08t05210 [Musa balbisiana]|uniref:Uncharacterized protein n=1 Tax=Musa balbisiana TaxID=52838 RepID=A0A4S8K1K7_MUSBA|nr:hypothetical protein C4D60_Mb08t05210 [Musa balbisiana]
MAVHVLRREERGIEGVRVAHRKRFLPPTPHNCRLSRIYPSIHTLCIPSSYTNRWMVISNMTPSRLATTDLVPSTSSISSHPGYLKYDSFEVGNN